MEKLLWMVVIHDRQENEAGRRKSRAGNRSRANWRGGKVAKQGSIDTSAEGTVEETRGPDALIEASSVTASSPSAPVEPEDWDEYDFPLPESNSSHALQAESEAISHYQDHRKELEIAYIGRDFGNKLGGVDVWKSSAPGEHVCPDLSSALKLQKLYACFPSVNEKIIQDRFNASGLSYEVARASLLQDFPALFVTSAEFEYVRNFEREEDKELDGLLATEATDAELEKSLARVLDNSNPDELANAAAVASAHHKGRAEAFVYQKQRNVFFMSAARAFQRGDGESAKQMAKRGRLENERAAKAHLEAMVDIFIANNLYLDNRFEVDFHGLHVREGLHILDFLLRRHKAKGYKHVVVIIGEGNNSVGRRSRLKPAFTAFLSKNGYKSSGHKPGSIKIYLAS